MSNSLVKTIDNEFIQKHVTDSVYRNIIKELSETKDNKGRGRKIELTAEKLHNFLFYLSMGNNYKIATELANIPENTRQKYMVKSKTFRRVASLAKENLSIAAIQAVYNAIVGRKPGYYQFIHPVTKESKFIFIGETLPNVKVAMWWLEKNDYFKESKNGKNENQLGAPRNEEEQKLLEELLNRHYDYINSKKKS